MLRCALILSLALHAFFLGVIAGWSPGTHGGSGIRAVDALARSGDTFELLLAQDAPAGSPELAPSLAEAEISEPVPSADLPIPAVSAVTDAAVKFPSRIDFVRATPPIEPHVAAVTSGRTPTASVSRADKSVKGRHMSSATGALGDFAATGHGLGGSGYAPPQFRLRYKPPYPASARAQHWEGTVLLLVSVDSAGRVTQADLHRTCGHAVLDRAALDAVRSWRFAPARQDGSPVAAQVEVPVRFQLG